MPMGAGKIRIVFDLTPAEREQLAKLCSREKLTQIDFLRRAMADAEKQIAKKAAKAR